MVYNFNIEVPQDGSVATSQATRLKLTAGVIHQVEVYFPAGCAGLVHCHINDGLYQVWPSNPDDNMFGDDSLFSFEEDYELDTDPYELTVYAWNEDDTYNHTIRVSLGILPRSVIYPWSERALMYEQLRGF